MQATTFAASELQTTEENRARQALGLENGPDIDRLNRLPTARDRRRYKALMRDSPGQDTLSIDDYMRQTLNARIVETVKSLLAGKPSLIKYLFDDVLQTASTEELRATPSIYLQQILESPPAQDLADRLLRTLKWYGARPGEQTPAAVRYQLVCKAIYVYLHSTAVDKTHEFAGFNWLDPAHWGKSYPALRTAFEQHLLLKRWAHSTKGSIMLAHVLQPWLSKDFAVRDIPADLRYKSSLVWVNFMHGVLLADELGLNRPTPLSFQQLIDLPLQRSATASPEALQVIARLRMSPALQWAICVGVVASKTDAAYDAHDIERALTALESHGTSLYSAVQTLDIAPPDRLKMAKRIKDEQFGAYALEADGYRFFPLDSSSRQGARDVPTLKLAGRAFLDLYADGQFDNGKRWGVTQADGKTPTRQTFRIDEQRVCHSERKDPQGEYRQVFQGEVPIPSMRTLPDVNALFQTDFDHYLSTIRSAYQTLIASLLASLPLTERGALEDGDVRVLGLRSKVRKNGTPTDIHARKGFVLKVTHAEQITYYELIPSAGFIRLRTGLRFSTINGVYTEFPLHAVIPNQTYAPERDLNTSLRLDWPAHVRGTVPTHRGYIGFLDEVGKMPTAKKATEAAEPRSRLNDIAQYIASTHLFVDEQHLRLQARGMTEFDTLRVESAQRRAVLLEIVKGFVPFWGSIEDLSSDDTERKILGAGGLFLDLASFLFPIGKFISGSVRLARVASSASRLVAKASLPTYSGLARQLLTASLQNLNPLDGLPSLLKSTLSGAGKTLHTAASLGTEGVRRLIGKTGSLRQTTHLPQVVDPGRWKPLTPGDELATLSGINDVVIRNTGTSSSRRVHLVDPLTSLPYGPHQPNNRRQFIPGRSTFTMLPATESHALALVPAHANVHELLETDGRITLLIDDIPYRLDGDQLRRADLINESSTLKSIPCRLPRMDGLDAVCKTRYVTGLAAPTPSMGSHDPDKGFAEWFGDMVYTPAFSNQPLRLNALRTYRKIDASLLFQKGLYARIKANLPYRNRFDTLETGAVIVPAIDDSKHYVFTRLGPGDFYVAERQAGQDLPTPLTLLPADNLPADLAEELKTVYVGSLNANNMARIYGADAVERAMKTMDEIAIPIGGHANPPEGLKRLKVDTSPGEAVLFDHSTRMIVTQLANGAASWSRSRNASDTFRQRTAQIFDTLFAEKTITVELNSDLKINKAMQTFQKLLPVELQSHNPRNIAFADVVTAQGKREVYVSVSGALGLTGELPLFKPPFASNGVVVNGTTYFNVDFDQTFTRTSLNVSSDGKLLAIPHTIKDIESYTPQLTRRPTSLDSEAKLISTLREKYPQDSLLASVDVATTLPPCNSCAVVIKEFGHDGAADALQVLWK
ncbi:hypothetical protein [Pseudomonas sp. S2_C03]